MFDTRPTQELRQRLITQSETKLIQSTTTGFAPRPFNGIQADLDMIQRAKQELEPAMFWESSYRSRLWELHKHSPRFPTSMDDSANIELVKGTFGLPSNNNPTPRARSRLVSTLGMDVLIKNQLSLLTKEAKIRKARRMRAKTMMGAATPQDARPRMWTQDKPHCDTFRYGLREFNSITNNKLGEEDGRETEDDFDYDSDDYGSEFDNTSIEPMDEPATATASTPVIEFDETNGLETATDDSETTAPTVENTTIESDAAHEPVQPTNAATEEQLARGEDQAPEESGRSFRFDEYFDSETYYEMAEEVEEEGGLGGVGGLSPVMV